MVNPYLKRRQKREAVDCLHPDLEPVLGRTLGIPLFQEQLLRMAMIAAGFSGGDAEELRRALGFKRSEKRMKEVETKLRLGMEKRGITLDIQEKIIRSITSLALYGFPESHAASFALLAYASAYLKCHYLAAFTAAMLNNQPMGFYNAATLVKDAQRHGLRVRPIDITCSEWLCTLEKSEKKPGEFFLRLGLRYVKGLREEAGKRIAIERAAKPFASIEDLKLRVPTLHKSEMIALAGIGALNFITGIRGMHRRDALWQIERTARRPGPLLELPQEREISGQSDHSTIGSTQSSAVSPLAPMTTEERLVADFHGTGMTVGSASDGLSPCGDAAERHSLRQRTGNNSGRYSRSRCGIGDRAPAPRHGQRLRFSQHGRRNRHCQCHYHAPAFRAKSCHDRLCTINFCLLREFCRIWTT